MAHVNVSKEIPATRDTVWAALTSPLRYAEWLTLHTKWRDEPPAEVAQGTQMTEVLTIMGMANTITWNTDAYDAPNTMSISGTGMAGAKLTLTMSVAAKDDSSSVATIEAEFVSQMMVGAIGGAIERATVRELEASLEKFAGLLA
ncbi:type II toxin-antitoxin system Rv0910 family toxin [Nocardia concava]|uniref:type II toxin-antitoxin system Rv0910 family toxin n=1 Tax=Nocardia concava TaxID=257281 RepID=UPI0002DA988A|nr:SRPBCC family protein [Nocardia concava]